MRIGIDSRLNYYRPGGTVEYTRQVIRALAALDTQSDYRVIQHVRDRDPLCPGANFRRLNTLTPCHHRLERWSLSAELLPHRLDLLHTPDIIPPQGGARRHVITIHDLHFLHYPQFMTADSRRHYRDRVGWAVRHADHILVSSQSTLHDISTLLDVPRDKVTVHMLGVDVAFRPLPAGEIERHRQRLGLPPRYLLFVGTFEPRKNIPGLARAYRLLLDERADCPPLVLVGRRGWLYDDIFREVEALRLGDHLIWREDAPWADLPAIYNGAAVLVLPSHYEGFGLTAAEALACGTPTVASNRSSIPEVVGEAGLLVDPDDPAALADAIRRVLDDAALRDRLKAAGPARATMFTWRHTAEIVLDVYRRVLAA